MSKGKWLLIALTVIVVAVGGVLFYTLSNLDSIVKAAIEKYGSQVTQTAVGVSGVQIGLTDGTAAMSGLRVANPGGFSGGDIFSLGKIAVKLDTASITKDTIIIPEILISAPKVLFEVDGKGRSNLDVLKKNVQQATGGGSGGSGSTADSDGGKKLIIKRLVIDNGEADINLTALVDKQLNAKLPRIELKNIGDKQGGATPAEVGKIVIGALNTSLGNLVANMGVQQLIQNALSGKLGEAAGAAQKAITDELGKATGDDAAKKATDTLKGLLGNK